MHVILYNLQSNRFIDIEPFPKTWYHIDLLLPDLITLVERTEKKHVSPLSSPTYTSVWHTCTCNMALICWFKQLPILILKINSYAKLQLVTESQISALQSYLVFKWSEPALPACGFTTSRLFVSVAKFDNYVRVCRDTIQETCASLDFTC